MTTPALPSLAPLQPQFSALQGGSVSLQGGAAPALQPAVSPTPKAFVGPVLPTLPKNQPLKVAPAITQPTLNVASRPVLPNLSVTNTPAAPTIAPVAPAPAPAPVQFPAPVQTPSGNMADPATGAVMAADAITEPATTIQGGATPPPLADPAQGAPGIGSGYSYDSPEYKKAVQDYKDAQKMTPEEEANQKAQDDLESSLAIGKANTGNQPIPLEFITGQQKAIQDRALALDVPLQKKAALLQAKRTASIDASKFALDEMDKKVAANIEANKPVSVAAGSTLINPKTGKAVYSAPSKPDTSVTEVGGHKLLIDNVTGATIKDLGTTASTSDDQVIGSQVHSIVGKDSSGNPFTQAFINLTDFPDSASKKQALAYGAQNGIPVLNPGEGEKMVSITNAYTNIDKMGSGLDGLLATTPGLNITEGLWNSLTAKFGSAAVSSFNAWRTAVINNVQALAGGSGSGLRINQAEIDTALKNDLPNVQGVGADTVASAQAKLARLKEQLDSWRGTILNKGVQSGGTADDPLGLGFNSGGASQTTPIKPTAFTGPVQLGSHLAVANNNPGNLRYVGQPGATQGAGGFAKFSSPQAGVAALTQQIALDTSRGHTLASFISKYAPSSENNTTQYIQQAVKALGVSPNAKLASIDPKKLAQFIALKESSSRIA